MSLHKLKSLAGVFVLLAFISMGVFGLLQFNHADHLVGTPMINCPYAENSYSICENTLDHINKWQQFSTAIFPSLFVFLVLILGVVLYFFGKQNFFNQKQHFYKWKYYLDNKNFYSYSQEINKWLSLFENSPSLSYVRHS